MEIKYLVKIKATGKRAVSDGSGSIIGGRLFMNIRYFDGYAFIHSCLSVKQLFIQAV
jgi:hypothetical protein